MPFSFEFALLGAACLILLSVIASKLSDRFAIPALAFFILIGILAGVEGLGGVHLEHYEIIKSLSILSLVIIIFSGGIDTDLKEIRAVLWQGILLSTIGVVLSSLAVAWFAVTALHFSWWEGVLLGAIISSTDAAAVFCVLRTRRVSLKGSLRPLLEFESSSNDPMALFLTLMAIGILQMKLTPQTAISMFVTQMSVGAILGWLMARGSLLLINKLKLESAGLYPALTLALLILTFSSTEILGGSGLLATYLMGLLMGRQDFLHKKAVKQFYEGLAWIVQIVMFIMLGLMIRPSEIPALLLAGISLAVFLILVARPLSVILSLLPFKIGFGKKLFISWVGLRGAAPIVLATFPLLAGIPGAPLILKLVFIVVIVSIIVQGSTIPFVARFLDVDVPMGRNWRSPIRFERTEGIDANLTELIVPYESACVGQAIVDLKVPSRSLIVLISRDEKFIIPNGATIVEGGDVLLVLAGDKDFVNLQNRLLKLKKD